MGLTGKQHLAPWLPYGFTRLEVSSQKGGERSQWNGVEGNSRKGFPSNRTGYPYAEPSVLRPPRGQGHGLRWGRLERQIPVLAPCLGL